MARCGARCARRVCPTGYRTTPTIGPSGTRRQRPSDSESWRSVAAGAGSRSLALALGRPCGGFGHAVQPALFGALVKRRPALLSVGKNVERLAARDEAVIG